MCQMCDDPSLTPADMRAQMFQVIERYGWMIQYVQDEPGYPAFAYTIGLTGRGLPEVYVEGLGERATATLLNDVAARMCDGSLRVGDVVHALTGRQYSLVPMTDVSGLYGALEAYGHQVSALRLTVRDGLQSKP